MKLLLVFWALPLLILGFWYYLSSNNLHFGFFMLTREAHDMVFGLYANMLGLPADILPPLVLRAVIVDSLLLFGLLVFRKRRMLAGKGRVYYARLFERE